VKFNAKKPFPATNNVLDSTCNFVEPTDPKFLESMSHMADIIGEQPDNISPGQKFKM